MASLSDVFPGGVLTNIHEAAEAAAAELLPFYKELHAHPEMSMQEEWTAKRIREELGALAAGLTGGADALEVVDLGLGVGAVLRNGSGLTVLARADFDGLPVKEDSGLPYASTATQVDREGVEHPVMHACGHDMHTTALLGALRVLAAKRDAWVGTYVAVFQPGEETAEGARSLVAAGLTEKLPRPDVCLGQHVLGLPAGHVQAVAGPVFSAGDSVKVTLYGKGSHGSMPHLSVDPVVLAAHVVTRLQGIVAREVSPADFAVVTVGSIHAGTKSNIIPESAVLQLNLRTFDTDVRERVIAAIERIVKAECQASGSPREPEFEYYDQFPLTKNHQGVYDVLAPAFAAAFGPRFSEGKALTASEDFSIIPDAWGAPYLYWTFGGFEGDVADMPGNHSPRFAPVVDPSLKTGVAAHLVAALAYFGKAAG